MDARQPIARICGINPFFFIYFHDIRGRVSFSFPVVHFLVKMYIRFKVSDS